jgi:hypothetical protein
MEVSVRFTLYHHRKVPPPPQPVRYPLNMRLGGPQGRSYLSGFRTLSNRYGRLHLKCDGTHAENRFLLLAKQTSPFKSAGASVQSSTGSLSVRISGTNAGYTMFRGSVKSSGYPPRSPVSPSIPPSPSVSSRAIAFQLDSTLLNKEWLIVQLTAHLTFWRRNYFFF